MVQIGVYKTFCNTENPETVNKVLFSVGGNDNFIEHVLFADILQSLKRVVDGKVGVLGIHSQVVFRRTASQNPVYQLRIVVIMFKGGQQHFLSGICINRIDTATEAFFFV